jgi:hypothetical protein
VEGVSDRDLRIGHGWVNHFGLAEFEGLLIQGGLRIEDRVQHDATQTLWKLTGVRRLRKRPDSPLTEPASGSWASPFHSSLRRVREDCTDLHLERLPALS